MSHPTEDELVDLAVGDDARDESVSAHVDACDECRATVAELRRTADLMATAPPYAAWQAPSPSVWDRINDQLTTDELTDHQTDDPTDGPTGPATQPPSAVAAAPTGAEPATPHTDDELGSRRARTHDRERRGRGRAIGWGAGLAAASLAIGLLAGRAIWQPETPAQPVAQVALATLDTKQDEGKATVVRSDQGLDLTVATATPLDAGNGYLEVWLLNADGKRMVSVGVLAPGDKASFPISQTLIDEGYVIVDISREKFDGSPTHSGDSLLRGKLPA
ncbi:MAG TPA: anti-sigma factor [Humibacillus sp.]|nr:anti-sigma factor [Humibacillus sp.]